MPISRNICHETSISLIDLEPVAGSNKVSSGDGAHGVQGEGGMDYEVLNQNDEHKEYLNLQY